MKKSKTQSRIIKYSLTPPAFSECPKEVQKNLMDIRAAIRNADRFDRAWSYIRAYQLSS